MKGIILAGGSGTRLHPITRAVSKQLLPVYDKPMIYYPLSNLMSFNICDILIISTPEDTPNIQNLFGDGMELGLNISYKVQDKPNGIAESFILGEEFIGNNNVCLILGDNLFYLGENSIYDDLLSDIERSKDRAKIFGYHVCDPERFGVVEFDSNGKVISIEEKPSSPKSNYAVTGLYFYPSCVVSKAKKLKPSKRGELEITDINQAYLSEGRLDMFKLKRGSAWLDAGTPNSLLDSSNYIAIIEKRQGIKVACIEEIAYRNGFITKKELSAIIAKLKIGNEYRQYLEKIYNEHC